ncbi:MAG: Rne/Rng family ribonuclease [Clostridia bacterium]|nr:Rne/Rng family ribonuclease [Clostridia bacterium]
MQELIVIQKDSIKQIYLVEDGILKEYYSETSENKNLEENIYIGKVTNILPGMQAAFVDIGEEKKAYLHLKDILPKVSNVTGNKEENIENYKIKDFIKQNEPILVQVKKDSNTLKGPKVSSNIQIPGRFVVILPENDFITISQKIVDQNEKNRLIDIVNEAKKDSKLGIIIRTAAEGKDSKLIKKDIENTIKKWENLKKEFDNSKEYPRILKRNESILEKILLDLADNKLKNVIVNNEELQKHILDKLNEIQGKTNIKVELQEENLDTKYDLDKQLEKAQNRKIWLKCGGFITIDKTEALTAIDVNSGKFTGKENIENTILKVNKEASEEIAKQIRLRDIGGIIIIDYIDMEEEKTKNEVLEALKEKLKEDRAKTQIMQYTKLNLLEMTRKSMFTEK